MIPYHRATPVDRVTYQSIGVNGPPLTTRSRAHDFLYFQDVYFPMVVFDYQLEADKSNSLNLNSVGYINCRHLMVGLILDFIVRLKAHHISDTPKFHC